MPISYDSRNKRWRYFFDRKVAGARQRASRLLPKGWSKSQAQEYDRIESARLYSIASGVEKPDRLIEEAVLTYLEERGPALKNLHNMRINIAACHPAFAGRPLGDLAAISREYALAQAGILAPATIRNRLAYIRAACRYVWKKHGWTENDPAARMSMPSVKNARKVFLSRAEMLTICRKVPAIRRPARTAIRVAFYSGMRVSEICRARAEADCFVLDDTKNGEPRIVPIHRKISHIPHTTQWPIGFTVWSLSKMFKAAAAEAGFNDVHFHDLRHSTASEMVNAGVDLFTVGAVLGHKSQQSTQRYSHLRQQSIKDAMRTIGGQKKLHKI